MEPEQKVPPSNEYEVIDLSQAEVGPGPEAYAAEEEEARSNSRPKLYSFIIDHSGGAVKDEKQAQSIAVLTIIILNLVTFYLITGGAKKDEPANIITASEASQTAPVVAK